MNWHQRFQARSTYNFYSYAIDHVPKQEWVPIDIYEAINYHTAKLLELNKSEYAYYSKNGGLTA